MAVGLMMMLNMQKGLYELIDVLILFCALARMDFCCMVIYLINIALNFFLYLNILGLLVQTGKLSEAYATEKKQSTQIANLMVDSCFTKDEAITWLQIEEERNQKEASRRKAEITPELTEEGYEEKYI